MHNKQLISLSQGSKSSISSSKQNFSTSTLLVVQCSKTLMYNKEYEKIQISRMTRETTYHLETLMKRISENNFFKIIC